jgi:putative Holliday junction resolvase
MMGGSGHKMSNPSRLLAVDFGSVRIGLAISDPDRKLAFPLEVRRRKGSETDAAFFRALVAREDVAGLVVGLPVHLNGHEGSKAREARAFGAWLATQTGLPVVFYDERFTTVEAENALWEAGLTHKRRKERRDKVAAQMLLRAYLDAGCPTESTPGALDDPRPEKETPTP